MTCKGCVHFDACKEKNTTKYYGVDVAVNNVEELCRHFKDKTEILELSVGDIIDVLFSHNEIVALWYVKPNDKQQSYLLYKGMAWDIPKQLKNCRFIKIFGTVPESINNADTINILVTPLIRPRYEFEEAETMIIPNVDIKSKLVQAEGGEKG